MPAGLDGVIAIEAGGFHSLALIEERPQRLLLELEEAVTGVGPGTSLVDKLRNAQAALAAHDLTAASRILNAFGNQVRAQAGKSIPKDTATTLISATTKITNMLSC